MTMMKKMSYNKLIYRDFDGEPAENLTHSEIIYDINVLYHMLHRGYIGYPRLADEVRNQVNSKLVQLSKKTQIARADFHQKITDILSMIVDNHLEVEPLAKKERLPNLKNIASTCACGWKVVSEQINKQPVLAIGASSFSNKNSSNWDDLAYKISLHKDEYSAIIIDLRGNAGGDIDNAFNIIVPMCGNNPTSPFGDIIKKVSKEALILDYHDLKNKRLEGVYDENSLVVQENELLANIFDDYSEDIDEVPESFEDCIPLEFYEWHETVFNKPVYILQDSKTGSASEMLIQICQENLNVTTVGQNTAGCVHYVTARKMTLPHSRVVIKIPTVYNSYKDGRFIENVGISPDIKIAEEEDALAVALKHLYNERMNSSVSDKIIAAKASKIFSR